MKRIGLVAGCVAAAWLVPGLVSRSHADAATSGSTLLGVGAVTVDLMNVESSKGQLLLALFRDSRGFPDGGAKAFATSVQKARAGVMRVNFENIPKGPFAVSVHHDEDSDFKMDMGLFGPTEGYGFSRNAHAAFGPPGFDDCKLMLQPGQRLHLQIKIRY